MSNIKRLETKALSLPPQEREQLVLTMWESLENESIVDPEGIDVALARDAEIEAGSAQPITHSEFRRRTSGNG